MTTDAISGRNPRSAELMNAATFDMLMNSNDTVLSVDCETIVLHLETSVIVNWDSPDIHEAKSIVPVTTTVTTVVIVTHIPFAAFPITDSEMEAKMVLTAAKVKVETVSVTLRLKSNGIFKTFKITVDKAVIKDPPACAILLNTLLAAF